jgi:glycosyltransferase involved in cell wall biosynthesis
MQSKLSVLQVIPNLNVSGAEQGCIDVANYLIENNYDSYVLTSAGTKIKEVEKKGTKVLLGPVNSKNPFVIFKNIFLIISNIKKYNIKIIHVRSRAPAWSVFFVSKFIDIKCISTFHGTYNFRGYLKKLYNSVMLRMNGTIAISNFIHDHIKKNYSFKKNPIQTIERGIDLNFFNPKSISKNDINNALKKYDLKEDSIKILLPARVTGWKGHLILVDAVSQLLEKKVLNIEVLFFGPDQNRLLKEKIENFIRIKNLQNIIKFYGPTDKMNLIYSLSDIVISSSTDPEAFGRVSIEAQAMGKIIIASNHGGSQETIIEGKTGYLYSPKKPIELMEKILYTIAQKKYCSTDMSELAMNHIRNNYGKDKMCKRTLEFYQKIIS